MPRQTTSSLQQPAAVHRSSALNTARRSRQYSVDLEVACRDDDGGSRQQKLPPPPPVVLPGVGAAAGENVAVVSGARSAS